jgi:hypothetical protein
MMRLPLASALALAGVLGCSADPGNSAPGSFPATAFASLKSDTGDLTIEVRTAPDQPPVRGLDEVEYRITIASSPAHPPAEGLSLGVVPWMTAMGHGASVAPTVTDDGGGRYVISDLELFMPGEWELRTTIAGASDDGVTPILGIP